MHVLIFEMGSRIRVMNRQGFAPILIIIVIAALLVGGYVIYRYSISCFCIVSYIQTPSATIPSQVIAQNTTSTRTDTSNWKTYRNEKYGFEFRYPTDWIDLNGPRYASEDTLLDIGQRDRDTGKYGFYLTLRSVSINDRQPFCDVFAYANQHKLIAKEIALGDDITAIEIVGPPQAPGGESADFYVSQKNCTKLQKPVLLHFSLGAGVGLSLDLQLVHNILSTFKFTK